MGAETHVISPNFRSRVRVGVVSRDFIGEVRALVDTTYSMELQTARNLFAGSWQMRGGCNGQSIPGRVTFRQYPCP